MAEPNRLEHEARANVVGPPSPPGRAPAKSRLRRSLAKVGCLAIGSVVPAWMLYNVWLKDPWAAGVVAVLVAAFVVSSGVSQGPDSASRLGLIVQRFFGLVLVVTLFALLAMAFWISNTYFPRLE